jgi:hypothetical protein
MWRLPDDIRLFLGDAARLLFYLGVVLAAFNGDR